MAGRPVDQLVDRLLPERQLFLKSRGRVRYLTLTKRRQLALLAIPLVAGVMVAYHFAARDDYLSEIGTLEAERNLGLNQQRAAEGRIARLEDERARARERLTRSQYLRAEPPGSLLPSEGLEILLGGAMRKPPAVVDTAPLLASTERLLEDLREERREAALDARRAAQTIEGLENRLASLADMQRRLIASIEGGAETRINDIEAAIAATGLDVDELLERSGEAGPGIGGPLIGLAEATISPRTHPEDRKASVAVFQGVMNRIDARLTRQAALAALLERLPLAHPLDDYYVTSRYGKRRDPYTRRWAVHRGLDLGGPSKAPVRAPAPGVVTYTGWKGPYGRMIKIDHGFGLKTVYAHLNRIDVKRGETVVVGQKVGVIGSSGRSTGRHLHYEIRFDGDTLNPATFLKAGENVFKN